MDRNAAAPHDNVDVRINNKINTGNIVVVSLPATLILFLFLFIFMRSYWPQTVILAAILVYGLAALFAFLVVGLVVGAVFAVWIRFVWHPRIDAREREAIVKGQEMRNQLIHSQPEGVVLADPTTQRLYVERFLLPPVVEADKPGLNEQEVVRTYQLGLSIKDTAKQHQGTEYEVRKILQKADVIREK